MVSTPTNSSAPAPPRSTPNGWASLLPSAFLQTGTNAGGDLSGTYPSPSIANGVISDAKVASANKDGAANVPLAAHPGQQAPWRGDAGQCHTRWASDRRCRGGPSGTYPNPSLNVTGGPCPNGKALTNVSALVALTCGPGLYTDGNHNLGAVFPTPFSAVTLGSAETAVGYQALASVENGGNNTAGWGRCAVDHHQW